MRRLLLSLGVLVSVSLLFTCSAWGYAYWNDIRHSASLPDDGVVVRVENPSGGGEENYILYEGAGIEQTAMSPVLDGPSTLSASVPGPVAGTRYYGFRLELGDELDLMPVRVADGLAPDPEDLTQLAPDAAGDEIFGYTHLDLVDCHVGFSGTELHASLTNAGGGFPVAQGLTFFSYLLGIADPAQADPDTVFGMIQTYEQAGIISPGLYKITGTGFGDLVRLGDIEVQEYPASNTLVLSCQLADLMSDPYFQSWYDPSDPAIGVLGLSQRITLLGGAQEADSTPGGRCYLREFSITAGANQLPGLSGALFEGAGALATAQIDYVDPDGHCPVVGEIVFDESDTFALRPQSLDYGTTVTYLSDEGIEPLASGTWTVAVFRFSDNLSDVVEYLATAADVPGDSWTGPPEALVAMSSPNPIRGGTRIALSLSSPGRANVSVYDVRGALIRTLVDRELPAGETELPWDATTDSGKRLPSGIYFLRAYALGETATHKLVLIR